MRKTLIASFAALSVLAACSTEKDSAATTMAPVATDAPDTSSETTEAATSDTLPPVVDDRAPGVTDDTIKIGVTYDDLSKLRDIIGFDHGDYETAYGALVDEINAAGGIHGRKLELVFAPVNPATSDAAPAACTKLTQDEEVFLVMGFFMADEALCYVDTHETIVMGGTQTAENLPQAKVLWLTTDPSANTSVRGLQALIDAGQFSGTLAVVGSTGDENLYKDAIEPMLAAAGIEPVDVAYVDTSSNDSNQAYADSETLAERFQSDGATQVLLIGEGSSAYFPVGLARSDYRPQLIFQSSNGAGTYAVGEGNDLSVMEGSITSGGFGKEDIDSIGGATAKCLATERAAGLTLMAENLVPKGESKQLTGSYTACRNMAILVAILEKAGPTLNYGTFTTAFNSLGEIQLAGGPDPWTFGADSLDGSPVLYAYRWDADKKTMVMVEG